MSTILVDNLTGKTSAGDITVTSEGGAATQSLQQGLAKAWANTDSGTTTRGSFNLSSLVDNGTGDYNYNFTNSMSNDDFTTTTSAFRDSNTYTGIFFSDQTTALTRTRHYTRGTSTSADADSVYIVVHGDLA